MTLAAYRRWSRGAGLRSEGPGKLDTVGAKGERILLTRHAEPAKDWDGES